MSHLNRDLRLGKTFGCDEFDLIDRPVRIGFCEFSIKRGRQVAPSESGDKSPHSKFPLNP